MPTQKVLIHADYIRISAVHPFSNPCSSSLRNLLQADMFDVLGASKSNILQGRASGRLLVYRAKSGAVDVLLEGLWFANGVALSSDEAFVLVAETPMHRVMRYYLTGPRKGSADVFADNLPGFVDGVSLALDGNFWIAIVQVVTPATRFLMTAMRSYGGNA